MTIFLFLSPVEGLATTVNVALGGSNRPTATGDLVILHPSYNAETHENDVALLRLTKPVKVDDCKIEFERIRLLI